MTFRERLADWISGGAVTRARNNAEFQHEQATIWAVEAQRMHDALRHIAAMETPGANATVRRMALIAREAME